jgi:hypothetical protein
MTTVAQLRAEGVIEICAVPQSSVLCVLTQQRLHLFHQGAIQDRELDTYAVQLAVAWAEQGICMKQIGRNLGVDERIVRAAFKAHGYEYASEAEIVQRKRARAGRRTHIRQAVV